MRYAVVSHSLTVKPKLTNSVAAAFDHMASEHRRTDQQVQIWNRETGALVRTRGAKVKAVVELPALKLSDAMKAALQGDDSGMTGLPGKANTLKALEARGLVKIQNDGVARLTNLGRQYSRV
jgi:hypothetical protein